MELGRALITGYLLQNDCSKRLTEVLVEVLKLRPDLFSSALALAAHFDFSSFFILAFSVLIHYLQTWEMGEPKLLLTGHSMLKY